MEFLDRCLVLMVLIFHFLVNFVTLSTELLVDLNYSFHKVNMKGEKLCETNEPVPCTLLLSIALKLKLRSFG